MRQPLDLGGETIAPGTRRIVNLPLSMMSDHTPATLSVQAIHGRQEGPTIFVSAAIHGDEIIGTEIVRRLARTPALRRVRGTVLLIPIVNTFGFIGHSRYLPDRRDLNRSFPGNAHGSLAARLADLFLTEIVEKSDYGIDLHSAAIHRENLPQIRFDFRDRKAAELADAFGALVNLNSVMRHGSLRLAASEKGVPVLVFEAGEGLRFDEFAIRVGVKGVLRVMAHLDMIPATRRLGISRKPPSARRGVWQRAVEGGLWRARKKTGAYVHAGEVLGVISDPFGAREAEVRASDDGLIVGRTNLPLVNQGDALVHIALVPKAAVGDDIAAIAEAEHEDDPLFDEDEIL
jgi:predicted deacylase